MNRRDLEMHLQDLLDGRIEADALQALQQELRANAAARDAYRDYVHLHNALQLRAVEPVTGRIIHSDPRVEVRSLALRHRIPTTGFLFREQPAPRPLRRDMLHLIPHFKRNAIKAGEDLVLPDGTRHLNAALTGDPPLPRSYAYCSDTAHEPSLVPGPTSKKPRGFPFCMSRWYGWSPTPKAKASSYTSRPTMSTYPSPGHIESTRFQLSVSPAGQ